MTSGVDDPVVIRKASEIDLHAIKIIADRHRYELGFVLTPSLVKSISDGELFVAEQGNIVVGFVHYHHRKDHQTTLYHIAVNPQNRNQGIGRSLIEALDQETHKFGNTHIQLKCPQDLRANEFYRKLGFILRRVEAGRLRPLGVWIRNCQEHGATS